MSVDPNSDVTSGQRSRAYDSLYEKSSFQDSAKFYAWLFQQFTKDKKQPNAKALDLGCGIGGAVIAAENAGWSITGLDLSSKALELCKKRTKSPLVLGDGCKLPFEDSSFDIILNLGNLEHFLDIDAGIEEMRRSLKADGQAWILLPNVLYSGVLWNIIRKGYGPDHHQPIDRFATRNEWRDYLESGGLRVKKVIPYHKGKWWKKLLPSNLAWHFLYCCEKAEPLPKKSLAPLMRMNP